MSSVGRAPLSLDSVHSDNSTDVELREEPTTEDDRTWWASADPAIGYHRGRAQHWRVFINLTASASDESDRVRVDRIHVITVRAGSDALPEIEDALRAHGFTRSSAWQVGSGRGYVCWLTLDPTGVE